jgi:hypothetical protein
MSQALRKLTAHHQEDQLHGHLHQPDPHEDRRDVRQPRDDDGRQRAEVLRLGAARYPPHRHHQEGRRGDRQRNQASRWSRTRSAPRSRQAEFDILFGEGISREGEIIDMGVVATVVEKSGAWYAYNGEKSVRAATTRANSCVKTQNWRGKSRTRFASQLGIAQRPAAANADAVEA